MPDIDGIMVTKYPLDSEKQLRLETNRFVYAMELHADLNRFIFEQLKLIPEKDGKSAIQRQKEVVVQFYKYYAQIRDFNMNYDNNPPTQLLKNYITALIQQAIDPDQQLKIEKSTPLDLHDPMALI